MVQAEEMDMRRRKWVSERAKQLRELRIQKGYSRVELSMKAGVSDMVIYKIEAFGYIPTEPTIEKLAAVLGEEVWALFG
jgi:transcriptional regulator with XRE-family HTH domain